MDTFYDSGSYVEKYDDRQSKFSLGRAEATTKFVKDKSLKVQSLLDLACGTGLFLDLMQKNLNLHSCVGLDFSKKMIAYSKKHIKNENVKFVYGDMTNFDLGQKFDLVTCNYDAINHLGTIEDWEKTFKKAFEHLNAGGCFIFDFNTVFKMKTFNMCSCDSFEGYDTIYQTNNSGGKLNFCLTIFTKKQNGIYEKEVLRLSESVFEAREILRALKNVGFGDVKFCDANFKKCKPDKVRRVFAVCRKI